MENFFMCLVVFMFIAFCSGFGYVLFLMGRYIEKAEYAIRLYEMCKYVIPQNISLSYPIKKKYRDECEGAVKAEIEFYSSYEASQKVLLAVEEALKCYDKLGYIAIYSMGEMNAYKTKLDDIYKSVKKMQEQLQS